MSISADLPATWFIEPLGHLSEETQSFRCKMCHDLRFRTKAGALQHATKKHKKQTIPELLTPPQYCENDGNEFSMVNVKVEPPVEIESYGSEFHIFEVENGVENNEHYVDHDQNATQRPKRQRASVSTPLYYESDDEVNTPVKQMQIENENNGKTKRGRPKKTTPKESKKQKKQTDDELYTSSKKIQAEDEDTGKIKRSRQKRTTPKVDKKKSKKQKDNQIQDKFPNHEFLEVNIDNIKKEVEESEECSEADSNDSDYEDPDKTTNKFSNKKRKTYPRNAPYTKDKPLILFKPTYTESCEDVQGYSQRKWLEFIQINYVYSDTLFKEFLPNIDSSTISDNAKAKSLEHLLPAENSFIKITLPCKLKMFSTFGESKTKNLEWHTLKRFQSTEGTSIEKLIYLGAPIKSLIWLPLPTYVNEQYLCVTYRENSSASAHMRYLKPNINEILLLFYKITMPNGSIEASIHYGLKIPNGPINTMDFLPSGGYDLSQNRLGLLAVGGVSSKIDVYALPIEPTNTDFIHINDDLRIHIIQLSTAFELIVDVDIVNSSSGTHKLFDTRCQRICWSEFSGHQNIFASFSNGYIAAWNIKASNQDELNLSFNITKDGKRYFTPLTYFDFEESSVSGLAIHYDTYGPRWLTAFATSRRYCVYDIRDITQPIPIKEDNLKTVARCVDWCPIWETFSVGMCDVVPNCGCTLTVFNIIGINFLHLNLANSAAGISQVHFNPWQNITLFTADNGDLGILSTTELNVDILKAKRNLITSIMDIKCMQNNETLIDGDSISNNNKQEKTYGIIFGEFARVSEDNYNVYRNENRRPATDQQLLTRINIARWNLNAPASNVLAVGYENGILRLCRFDGENFF